MLAPAGAAEVRAEPETPVVAPAGAAPAEVRGEPEEQQCLPCGLALRNPRCVNCGQEAQYFATCRLCRRIDCARSWFCNAHGPDPVECRVCETILTSLAETFNSQANGGAETVRKQLGALKLSIESRLQGPMPVECEM